METTAKSLISIIFLTMLITGSYATCPLASLLVVTKETGAIVGGKKLFKVTIYNKCTCPQSQIVLNCRGFTSTYPIDRSILIKQGDNCLLFNGHALVGNDANQFAYAWDAPFNLYPVSAVTGSPCK
ncbi:uncharacterized protein LOC123896394 [Trifolium pratense]|uniref:Uncharacterized protein n=1 Tax=Trifolium pratense TaxID=57577 RepID=A0ACB0KRX2_TRIPR|nr:uncharacterized protein LOC123896394 [Trifolium pratense]CAJ2659112.1 unnamed protein product [Trifolium pratense]